jgi:plasmid stabilization system protein ParE
VRVRLHPEAAGDLTSAGDWYEQQLSGLGADLADEVDHALEAIAERPMTWPLWPGIGEAAGVRRFLLARFPFAVGYVVEGDEVVVLAVAHLRRRPGFWLERLLGGR